jgi:undecaprenyl diphosphate synthase
VYAFSTENWKRPQEEVNILMDLLVEYLSKELDELCAKNVKINIIGKKEGLPEKACAAICPMPRRKVASARD